MKVFLAGENGKTRILTQDAERRTQNAESLFILESYWDCRKNTNIIKMIPTFSDFLLDSGAFTFMSNKNVRVNWDRYVDEYADFVKTNKIDKFFELDIDCVVGLQEVERLRRKLESLTGKQSIPVWHPSRGVDYFNGMARDYSYVAYGGLMTDGLSRKENEKVFPYFIDKAHECGAKIHGLGYTSCANLRKYHFDSVDSTAWLYGNLGGYIYMFNPALDGFFEKIQVPKGKRLAPRPSAEHNFKQWRLFQQYAYKYL